jgi:hypothetical protein
MIPVVNDKACEQVVKATAMVVISGIVYAGIWAMFFRGLYSNVK